MNTTLRWVVGSALTAVAGFALFVPKEDGRLAPAGRLSPRDSLFEDWNTERGKLMVLYRVVERGESRALAASGRAARSDAPTIRIAASLPPTVRERIERRVREELTAAGAVPTRYPIVIIADTDTSNASSIYTRAIVLPQRAGEPCTVVIRIPHQRRGDFFPVATQRLLGTCAFHAAFGAPGAPTAVWLAETRGTVAAFLQRPPAFANDTVPVKLGFSGFGWDRFTRALIRCRMGEAAACDDFVGPEPMTADPFSWGSMQRESEIDRTPLREAFPGVDVARSGSWSGMQRLIHNATLAELLAEIGPARFGELWRDERGLREAYRASVGQPFSSWVQRHVERATVPYLAGPGIPALATVLAVAMLLGLGGAAIGLSRRQMS